MTSNLLIQDLKKSIETFGNRDIEFCIVIGNKFYQQPIEKILITQNDPKCPFVLTSELTSNTYIEIFKDKLYDRLNRLGKRLYRLFVKEEIESEVLDITADFTREECIKYCEWVIKNGKKNHRGELLLGQSYNYYLYKTSQLK
jgi:hypothetical protein